MTKSGLRTIHKGQFGSKSPRKDFGSIQNSRNTSIKSPFSDTTLKHASNNNGRVVLSKVRAKVGVTKYLQYNMQV